MKINKISALNFNNNSTHFTIKKIYQVWKGRNYFLFKGNVFVGIQFYYGLLTNLYIHIYTWIYIIYIIMVYNYLCYIEIRLFNKNNFIYY